MSIRKLPPLLVNQIAAGEVIERPASVVKELVENSLDAGALRIDIQIEAGGRDLIRVSDDGGGIAAEELVLAVSPHATSKLDRPEQLAAIATLGFRGEALASIASVSRLRLSSRPRRPGQPPAEAGAALEAAGERCGPVEPVATAPGTVVEVRDLFFNTPARRKFMRSPPTEFGHIADLVGRIAMVRPQVGFSLTHDGRSVLDLAPTDSRRQRCLEILGPELDAVLLEFDLAEQPTLGDLDGQEDADGPSPPATRLWGLAGLPAAARATARFQYLAVNGRPVRDRSLQHAIREAYRGLVPPDKQPLAVVFIDLAPAAVDVNVHPAKTEVRFRDPNRMHGLVLTALRQRLLGADLTPSARLPGAVVPQPIDFTAPAPWTPAAQAGADPADPNSPASPGAAQAFVDYFKRMAPQQKGFVFQEVKRALAQDDPSWLGDDAPAGADQAPTPAQLKPQSILQVHKSYVVTEDEHGLVIIDQHALHERVMFEELRRRVLSPRGSAQNLESQRLLMPVTLPANPRRMAQVEQLRPLLERIGIELAPIGPAALAVHAFPSFLFDRKVDPGEFVSELLDKAEEGDLAEERRPAAPAGAASAADAAAEDAAGDPGTLVEEAVLHRVLDMMACKAAVKAGDHLSQQELAALLAQREQVERASNCPHGRPTTLRLSLRELEKQFGRT